MTVKVNWTRTTIIAALRDRGTTVAALADQVGLSRHTIYGALERPYPRVHAIVADALSTPRQTIWPQFYDAAGKRRAFARSHKRVA